MRETIRNPRYALPFLALSFVLCAVVALSAWNTYRIRGNDLRDISCATLNREVDTKQASVEAATVFARFSRSAEIQAFFQVSLPHRRDLLAAARQSLKDLDCPDVLAGTR